MLHIAHVSYSELAGAHTVRGSIPDDWTGHVMELENEQGETLNATITANTSTMDGHFYFDLNDFREAPAFGGTFQLRLVSAGFLSAVELFDSPGVWLTLEET